MPLAALRRDRMEVMGYFYRSNIHPFTECERRAQTLRDYAQQTSLEVIFDRSYDLEGFLQKLVFRESERCQICYHERLKSTALMARRGKFDAFSTTLLYSRYQKHDLIRAVAEEIAHQVGVPFHYEDYRVGWREGIDRSKQMGMYRQPYCGCIYSEKDRYWKPERKPTERRTADRR